MVEVSCIAATASPTDIAGVMAMSPNSACVAVPEMAATTWPPITFRGWEKGRVGAPNSNIAVAPDEVSTIVASVLPDSR